MKAKICNTCGVEKVCEGNFYKDSRYRGGYRPQCIACKREVEKRYAQTQAGKDRYIRKYYRQAAKFPDKVAARIKLRTAVKAGKVFKPDYCSACLNEGRIEGHHDDYSKPLEVRWLCVRCHHAAHNHLVANFIGEK